MKPRFEKIVRAFTLLYPNPKPFLHFRTPFESLIATILSAQCTDERVNIVTKDLFRAANTPEKTLALGEKKLMALIRPTGFYRSKAKNILKACKSLLENFDGIVPADLEKMQELPGVGRKTASVVLAQAFHVPTFPVDRHVQRVANRLELAKQKDPDKTDLELRQNIPQKFWIPLHLQLIEHGRKICRPKPKCSACTLLTWCPEGWRLQKMAPVKQKNAKK